MNFLEILQAIRNLHLQDIEFSKNRWKLDGLCELANQLEDHERDEFLAYLKEEFGSIEGYLWERKNDNLERLNWLDETIIKITKEEF